MDLKIKARNVFQNFLDKDEKIIWAGQPVKAPYMFLCKIALGFGVLWLLADLAFLFGISSISVLPFMLLHLLPFWLAAYGYYYYHTNYEHVLYAYSNKKIFIKDSGGANLTIIPLDEIE